jgi:hypothetical protein
MYREYLSNPVIATARRMLLLISIVVVLLATSADSAVAQCAMCKESLANSTEAAAAAKNFNLAILVLLVPPVLMFAGLFGMIYRSAKSKEDDHRLL